MCMYNIMYSKTIYNHIAWFIGFKPSNFSEKDTASGIDA